MISRGSPARWRFVTVLTALLVGAVRMHAQTACTAAPKRQQQNVHDTGNDGLHAGAQRDPFVDDVVAHAAKQRCGGF